VGHGELGLPALHRRHGLRDDVLPEPDRGARHLVPSVTDGNGLLNKGLNGTDGYGDYAFLPRDGEITYYNANYVQALNDAAASRTAARQHVGRGTLDGSAPRPCRGGEQYLWDSGRRSLPRLGHRPGAPRAGRQLDRGHLGRGDAARAASALAYLEADMALPYGNAFMDNDTLSGVDDASQRVYAFTSYPELVARFRVGPRGLGDRPDQAHLRLDVHERSRASPRGRASAPGGTPYEGAFTSMAHGWSTGVLPALTNELLGVVPTGAGFATWQVTPHPGGGVTWARGQVATPHGPLGVSWEATGNKFTLQLTVPHGTRGTVSLPGAGSAARLVRKEVGPGTYTFEA
jgi:hypothetical protein